MAIPQHTLLDRKVVEDRIVDILETSLDTVQLMTIDNDLAQRQKLFMENKELYDKLSQR